jgi:monofunctional biosynthetic peptidoglycan transglycosylase
MSTAAASMPRRKRRASVLRVILLLGLGFLLLPYLIAPIYLFAPPVSTPMLWRWITGARVERQLIPIGAVAPALPVSVVVAEDGQFCRHHGLDLGQIRAAWRNAQAWDDARGASTITQQVAKNLFLWPGRSVVRKVLEVPLAVWIDLVLPKRRIMEIYLNIAEWGPNGEFGIEAGARHAFGKPARALTDHEAALMAAILPNPIRRSAARPSPGVRRLSGIYEARAARLAERASCLRLAGF